MLRVQLTISSCSRESLDSIPETVVTRMRLLILSADVELDFLSSVDHVLLLYGILYCCCRYTDYCRSNKSVFSKANYELLYVLGIHHLI